MLFIGIDPGKLSDPCAWSMLRVVKPKHPAFQRQPGDMPPGGPEIYWRRPGQPIPKPPDIPPQLHLGWAARFDLKTPYPDIVDAMVEKIEQPPICDEPYHLIVDAGGVGEAVVDLFRRARPKNKAGVPTPIPITPITIKPDGEPKPDGRGGWTVSKRDLVVGLQVAFQIRQMWVADGIPELDELVKELFAFRVKMKASPTGLAHDSYEAREKEHDDMILATAIAVWVARRNLGLDRPLLRRKGSGRRFASMPVLIGDNPDRWLAGDVMVKRALKGRRRI